MASHSGTGDEGGSISLGASLVLRSLPSLLMINRETLVPGAASRDKQSSLLACSNDSHLLVGLAPSEPPFLLTLSSLAVTFLGLPFPDPSTTLALPLLRLFLAFRLSTYRK